MASTFAPLVAAFSLLGAVPLAAPDRALAMVKP
jgi:hypothetical protein